MPIYEYSCSQCGKLIDVLQKVSDPAPELCTACQAKGTLTRVVSRSSFVLKGGGWYSDLYSSSKGGAGSSSAGSSASSSTASSSSGGEASSAGSASSSAPSAPSAPSTGSGSSDS